MQLSISPAHVTLLDKGARVDYMGGNLWCGQDASRGIKPGDCKTLVLSVSLRTVKTDNGVASAVMVQGVISQS